MGILTKKSVLICKQHHANLTYLESKRTGHVTESSEINHEPIAFKIQK